MWKKWHQDKNVHPWNCDPFIYDYSYLCRFIVFFCQLVKFIWFYIIQKRIIILADCTSAKWKMRIENARFIKAETSENHKKKINETVLRCSLSVNDIIYYFRVPPILCPYALYAFHNWRHILSILSFLLHTCAFLVSISLWIS